MEILFVSLIFLMVLLLVIWRPFFKQKNTGSKLDQSVIDNSKIRHATNVGLYREHKKEIEKDYQEGGIDQENYQYLLAELDNSLLQDITAGNDDSSSEEASKEHSQPSITKSFSALWPLGLSVFVILFSVGLYNKQGSYQQLTQVPEGHGQQQANSPADVAKEREKQALAHVEKLQNHLKGQPDDTEAWFNLGQTYVAVGVFDAAVGAFKQVIKLEGEHADLLGAIAQALYYKNNQTIDAQTQGYIDKALALDINDASTNILLGMHSFIGKNYPLAISHWQRVIDANNPGVNIEAIKQAVAEAKQRGNLESTSNQPPSQQETAGVVDGPQLNLNISMTETVLSQISQGDDRVVFVYAVPTNGQRMPLAAVKLSASDLPITVTLNNSKAMSPAANLSTTDSVHIYAIIKKSGGVGIKPGDYKGEVLNVDVKQTTPLELIISDLVE